MWQNIMCMEQYTRSIYYRYFKGQVVWYGFIWKFNLSIQDFLDKNNQHLVYLESRPGLKQKNLFLSIEMADGISTWDFQEQSKILFFNLPNRQYELSLFSLYA
jgi:hypothetical protein